MQSAFLSFLQYIRDSIIPPRPTERIVRTLTPVDVQSMRVHESGALSYHDPLVRALVWEVKYYANPHAAALCGEMLAEALLAIASDHVGTPLLIPIPMHSTRRKERGHNQTEVLAEAALAHTGAIFEYAPHLLKRVVHTAQQQGLPQHKRVKNVAGSMRVTNPEKVKGRTCVILDDVSTTGATFDEAIRALKKAGAGEVTCISLAQS